MSTKIIVRWELRWISSVSSPCRVVVTRRVFGARSSWELTRAGPADMVGAVLAATSTVQFRLRRQRYLTRSAAARRSQRVSVIQLTAAGVGGW
jgi:hypothetical protein